MMEWAITGGDVHFGENKKEKRPSRRPTNCSAPLLGAAPRCGLRRCSVGRGERGRSGGKEGKEEQAGREVQRGRR
jgi:hypothetical protein